MGKTFESYIDLSGSLSTVSIALNGLLKINGPLTQVRNYYHIDVKHLSMNHYCNIPFGYIMIMYLEEKQILK